MKLRLFFCAMLLLLPPVGPMGAAQDPAHLCDQAAARAAQQSGVPVDILLAITRVETGRGKGLRPWPWTINADGQGEWHDTMDQAIATATAHQSDGTGTFDVGCFQLNYRWHGEHFASLEDMFDPARNADYAADYLMQLYQETGDWAAAVAAYHSRTPDLAQAYLDKVKAVLNDPSAPAPPQMDESETVSMPRENLFPLLQAGDQGSTGSIVPLTVARGRLIGG